MVDFSFVVYVNGILLMILAGVLAFAGLTGLFPDGSGGLVFIGAACVTLFFGSAFFLSNRRIHRPSMGPRTGYLLTVSSWITIALFSTLPLYYGVEGISFTDAVFETVSALTTTGSTVLTGLDGMAHDILLWRSLLQWMGGVGIVVMALALLPLLRVGGMNLFKSESSDISDKVFARLHHFVTLTGGVYILLTALCAALLRIAGMSWFDAINHAMTTLSTGGFSTHDASVGFFNSQALEAIIIVFMLAGAMPLVMYAHAIIRERSRFPLRRYVQVQGLLLVWGLAIASVTIWNILANSMPFAEALRVTAFNITSILTDTGFATADFSKWGHFAICIFFFLMFVGGCAGSTSGASKIFRWQLLFRGLYNQFLRNLSPNRVLNLKYAGKVVEDRILHSVRSFLFLYFLTFAVLSTAVSACNVDFLSSTSAVAQAMANAGPGLSEAIGPAGNFSSLPDSAKWILCLAMLLGRLELFTILALLVPDFWRR